LIVKKNRLFEKKCHEYINIWLGASLGKGFYTEVYVPINCESNV